MTWDYDCAVIGGGPGGLVSALYLARFKRSVAFIRWGKPRAAWIPRTHNLIGYDRGISGSLLLRRLERQLSRVAQEQLSRVHLFPAEGVVRKYRSGFRVGFGNSEEITVRKVILATGVTDVQPELENLATLRKQGLLRYCSICDGFEYRNQRIAVFAKDDEGLQKGLFIRQWTPKIHFLLPENFTPGQRRMRQIQAARVKVHPCRILKATALEENNQALLELTLNDQSALRVRVAYVELGSRVNSSAFENLVGMKRTRAGFIITTTEQRTSIPGVFAVGDCVNQLGQISVAAGQAAIAATAIHNDLLG
ncbi:MAG: hypothetical protein A2X94_12590 [Bdellovibrionales bacterium GWB1_55_8]|nr:MAG: hypothetical protein A2X94_12590 [Bdellovibrionales bacterium GWB1_55_8]